METAGAVALLLFLAALTETIVDMLKTRFGLGELGDDRLRGILWPAVAAVIGIGLAFAFGASIQPLIPESAGVALAWPLDRLLAGLLAGGGGASLIYDWLDRAERG